MMMDPSMQMTPEQIQYFQHYMMVQQQQQMDPNAQQQFFGYPGMQAAMPTFNTGYNPYQPMMPGAPMYGAVMPQYVPQAQPIAGTQGYQSPTYDAYGQPQPQGGYQRGGYGGGGRGGFSRGGGNHFHHSQGAGQNTGYFGGGSGGQQSTGAYPKRVDVNKYKTSICRHFQANGSCSLADNCQFAHGEGELRNQGDPIPPEIYAKLQSMTPPAPSGGYQQHQPSYDRGGHSGGSSYQRGGRGGSHYGGGADRGGDSRGGHSSHFSSRGGSSGGYSRGGGGMHGSAGGATNSYYQSDRQGGPRESKEQSANYKVSLCKNFSNGHCKYGNSCSFAHGDQDLRSGNNAGRSTSSNTDSKQQMSYSQPAPPKQPAPMGGGYIPVQQNPAGFTIFIFYFLLYNHNFIILISNSIRSPEPYCFPSPWWWAA